jgi:hypothetical protein
VIITLGSQMKSPNGRFLVIIGWVVLSDNSIGGKKKSPSGRFLVIMGWVVLDDFYHSLTILPFSLTIHTKVVFIETSNPT